MEIGADLPYVGLLDVQHDPLRFRWRLLGGHIVDTTGRNMTGRTFESMHRHPILVDVMRVFSRAAVTGLPIRYEGFAVHALKGHIAYESLHQPLFDESGMVEVLLAGQVFDIGGADSS